MKKILAFILLLSLAIGIIPCCNAESAIPAEVQAFYDALNEILAVYGNAAEGEIIYAENYEVYNELEDTTFLTATLSRVQYDHFYYWRIAEDMMVTICYIGDNAVAYILDGTLLPVQAGIAPQFDAFSGFTDAYNTLFPAARNDFYSDSIIYYNEDLDESAAEPGTILSTSIEYDDLLVTAHLLNSFDTYWDPFFADRRDMFSIQLQPYAAYEGLETTAQENHDLTCYMMLEANLMILQGTLDSLK